MGTEFFWFYDFILAAILICMMFIGTKKGFVRMVLSLCAFAASFVIALMISNGVSGWIYDSFISKPLEQTISTSINDALGDNVVTQIGKIDMEKAKINGKSIDSLELKADKAGKVTVNLGNVNLSNTGISKVDLTSFGVDKNVDYSNINLGSVQIYESDIEKYGIENMILTEVLAQNIKNSIHNMNIHLEKTLGEVDHLSDETKAMLDARNDVDKSLNQLDASNQDVMTEVENIQKQTQQNNESVEKIIAAVSYISDIADQTNLLSLNASIEAARAGETGKGFAVVAEEIGKLANQSNEASTEISELVNLLSYNSNQTMDIMDSVQDAMNDQTKKLVETANIFKQLQEHVSHVADGVDVIRDATVQLGKETDEIGKDIKNLSDIAQRNEDTVKGTISFSDEVLGTVNSVTEMSTEVSSSANDMAGVVSHFRM